MKNRRPAARGERRAGDRPGAPAYFRMREEVWRKEDNAERRLPGEPGVRAAAEADEDDALAARAAKRRVGGGPVDGAAGGRVDLQDLVRHAVADQQYAAGHLVGDVDDDALGVVGGGRRVDA